MSIMRIRSKGSRSRHFKAKLWFIDSFVTFFSSGSTAWIKAIYVLMNCVNDFRWDEILDALYFYLKFGLLITNMSFWHCKLSCDFHPVAGDVAKDAKTLFWKSNQNVWICVKKWINKFVYILFYIILQILWSFNKI